MYNFLKIYNMIYLNTHQIEQIGIHWDELISTIGEAVTCLETGDFAQPVKPYLRYREPANRIIAMPAFAGGAINKSGIKWIASFPGNLDKGIQRANSVTILNNADTGVPECIFNTAIISGIRTAAVSGSVLREYLSVREPQHTFRIGMTGFGPIGRLHLDMFMQVLGARVESVKIFDLRPVPPASIPSQYREKVQIMDSWQACYTDADIFTTCTVSDAPYINLAPKAGSLQLNVSLRDYKHETRQYFHQIVVDNWEEICREKTDIEMMHLYQGLSATDTWSLPEFIAQKLIRKLDDKAVLMFNPMGMAVFDIAIANYYYQKAEQLKIGIQLDA